MGAYPHESGLDRRHDCRRSKSPPHAQQADGLVLARHPANQQGDRNGIGNLHRVSRRQDGRRAHLLGSRGGATADREVVKRVAENLSWAPDFFEEGLSMSQALRFGTYTEIQSPPGRNHAELIWDVIALGEHADQRGFEVFCTLEHPFFEKFAINTNPLALFCTLAQRTRNLRFRALCHTLPLHNPMILAGEIAEADILTNGRLECGVGRGHAWLNEPANIVLEESQGRYVEALDILVKAWTEERFSYQGKYYQVKDLAVVPKPLQKPYPKIFQVGTSTKWLQ